MTRKRRFPPFASSRPGPQGFDPKAAIPACAPGDLYCVLDAAPIGPRPCRFVLVFVRLWLHEDGMHRRRFIALLGAAITAARTLRAQQKAMPVIGWLYGSSPPANPDDLIHGPVHQGLSETGFVEGQNMMSEYRSADFHYDRLPALAADLVSRKVDLIVTFGGAPSRTRGQKCNLDDPDRLHRRRRPNWVRPRRQPRPAGRQPHRLQQPHH
jgi:hypothetical protein